MNQFLKNFIEEKFKSPEKALDLGAGDLFDVLGLKQLGWQCDGVDIKTGTDLENPYLSENGPYDLVYSNYVLQKIKNKDQFIKTAFNNLKLNGWFFLHTLDQSDPNSTSEITEDSLKTILEEGGFKNIELKKFDFYDEEHKHWHKILEATAQHQ